MDATAAVTALQAGSMVALAQSLDWDEIETVTIEETAQTPEMVMVLARKGDTVLKTGTVNGGEMASVHAHDGDEDAARKCFARDVADAVQTATLAEITNVARSYVNEATPIVGSTPSTGFYL